MLNLTIRDTAKTIKVKLDELLADKNSVQACCSHLAKEKLSKDLSKKGIYFWFMPNEAYEILSNYVTIEPVESEESFYHKKINDVWHHLVYVGTTGTKKKEASTLWARLKSHICGKHTVSSICKDGLSTLRKGIGALLADDLILPNTEAQVNEFLCKYMKVYWIAYDNNVRAIDNDEFILIVKLRPLLNIKSNPNAEDVASPTNIYKKRRVKITKSTKKRIGCSELDVAITNATPMKIAPSARIHKYSNYLNDCYTFTVTVKLSIANEIKKIPNLPTGNCKVICKNSAYPHQVVYAKASGNGWRTTGNRQGQNIYSYFANVDLGRNNQFRWQIIQQEMALNKIAKIDVIVCKLPEN